MSEVPSIEPETGRPRGEKGQFLGAKAYEDILDETREKDVEKAHDMALTENANNETREKNVDRAEEMAHAEDAYREIASNFKKAGNDKMSELMTAKANGEGVETGAEYDKVQKKGFEKYIAATDQIAEIIASGKTGDRVVINTDLEPNDPAFKVFEQLVYEGLGAKEKAIQIKPFIYKPIQFENIPTINVEEQKAQIKHQESLPDEAGLKELEMAYAQNAIMELALNAKAGGMMDLYEDFRIEAEGIGTEKGENYDKATEWLIKEVTPKMIRWEQLSKREKKKNPFEVSLTKDDPDRGMKERMLMVILGVKAIEEKLDKFGKKPLIGGARHAVTFDGGELNKEWYTDESGTEKTKMTKKTRGFFRLIWDYLTRES